MLLLLGIMLLHDYVLGIMSYDLVDYDLVLADYALAELCSCEL